VGALFGPTVTANGGPVIVDVILFVEMNHTWIGDLQMSLLYDVDCDDTVGSIEDDCPPLLPPGC